MSGEKQRISNKYYCLSATCYRDCLDLNLFSGLKTKQKVFGAICAPLVLLVILGVVAIFAINSIIATDKEVHQTHPVLHESNEILAVALSMETSMRGFCLPVKRCFSGNTGMARS